MASFYLVSIPLACILVFVVGTTVNGLWLAILLGTGIQAIFYTRLVLVTDWQVVANIAIKRINDNKASLLKNS